MVSNLPNLGPKSLEMLAKAGIVSLDQLKALGAVRAYVATKRADKRTSLNLLWALAGAISGRHWQVVAREDRLALLMELERIEQGGE